MIGMIASAVNGWISYAYLVICITDDSLIPLGDIIETPRPKDTPAPFFHLQISCCSKLLWNTLIIQVLVLLCSIISGSPDWIALRVRTQLARILLRSCAFKARANSSPKIWYQRLPSGRFLCVMLRSKYDSPRGRSPL